MWFSESTYSGVSKNSNLVKVRELLGQLVPQHDVCTQTYLIPKLAYGQNWTTFDPKNSACEPGETVFFTPKLQGFFKSV
jgi:hypothetical protein